MVLRAGRAVSSQSYISPGNDWLQAATYGFKSGASYGQWSSSSQCAADSRYKLSQVSSRLPFQGAVPAAAYHLKPKFQALPQCHTPGVSTSADC